MAEEHLYFIIERTENSSQELEILSYERIKSLVNINGRQVASSSGVQRKQGIEREICSLMSTGPNLT